jgi:uncharacterized protein (DUF924 family)
MLQEKEQRRLPMQTPPPVPDHRPVLAYWCEEIDRKHWYIPAEGMDDDIRNRFGTLWGKARQGGCDTWVSAPDSALALIVLLDQFPRNMFRGRAQAFSTDHAALAAAKHAIDMGWDLRMAEPDRQFFYLPLMHSENACDQDRCVRLMLTRLPETGADNLLHARAHREVIRLHGRFPSRNAALGRADTAAEREFLESGGYGAILTEMRRDKAA